MSPSHNPARWLDGDQLAPEVRNQLASYAAEAPQVERRARMLASLEQQLGLTEAPAASSPGAPGAQPPPGGAIGAGTGATAAAAFKLKLVLHTLAAIGASLGLIAAWAALHPLPAHPPSQQLAARARFDTQDVSTPSSFRAVSPALSRWVSEISSPVSELETMRTAPEGSRAEVEPAAKLAVDVGREPAPRTRRVSKATLVSAHALAVEPTGPVDLPASAEQPSAPSGPASADLTGTHVPSAGLVNTGGASGALLELTLLAHARRVLLVNPERALELTEQHAREFPSGTLCEEREVLAIESLLKLGRGEPARQRALLFAQRFPNSAHRAHLARMIALPAD